MNARLELLRKRLGDSRRSTVRQRSNPEIAPLSAAQHRMWLHQQLHPGSSAYNVCIQMNFDGNLDETRLLDAIAEVIKRHDVLRTTYPLDSQGNPYQKIHVHLPPEIHVVEDNDPSRIAIASASTPFDISTSSPIRIHLVRIGSSKYSLVLTVHHIVWDGGCFGIFSRDLSAFYRGSEISPLPIQYADADGYQSRNDPRIATLWDMQLDYWRRTLTPFPPALALPKIRWQEAEPGERAKRLDRVMPPASVTQLRAAAVALRTTPFAVFIAVYALLLNRWTTASDITIGTMVANRHLPGVGDLIGNFGNTVLLRLDLSGDKTFRALVQQTSQVITDALSNSDVSYEQVVADLAPPREAGYGFFTDTLGLFLDRDIGGPDLPDVAVEWSNVFNSASPFALTFQGFVSGDTMEVEATFRSEQFAPETVRDMLEQFETILMAATANPERNWSCISALPPRQHERLIRLCTGTTSRAATPSVLDHWRSKVNTSPDQIALVHDNHRFSYAEVDGCANHMAAQLIALGIGYRDIVAVAVSRSMASIAAPIAIWKCGAIYLPLDPHHPVARLDALMKEAGTKSMIANTDIRAQTVPVLAADALMSQWSYSNTDPGFQPHAHDAAHISFTSGSTGRPKGVLTTHGSLAARTAWIGKHWPGGRGGARLAKSTPTAIDATAEFCEAFATGEYLVLATDTEARDSSALARLLKSHSIGHFMAVPGMIEAMAVADSDIVGSSERVLSTGEPLLPSVASTIYAAAKDIPLYNSYGCTETTGDVIAGRIHQSDTTEGTIPIGNPLPGSRCYILSGDLTLTPPGVLGDLYIDSKQLASGYLSQPGLTAASFVANPWGKGGRLYRTGDLARLRSDGRIELAGRSDDQVNVRGHRVEPAETLAALYKFKTVAEAAVLPRKIGSTNALIAYVAGSELKAGDGSSLRQELSGLLPGPLVPAEVIVMPRLPRLQGGKIDRKALSDSTLPGNDIETASRAPRNAQEESLTTLLAQLLGRQSMGIDDNFFACGGDSLLAVTFAARANAAGMHFPAAAVFTNPTIAQLVETLSPSTNSPGLQRPLPVQINRFRLSGLPMDELLTWYPLRHQAQSEALRTALVKVIARHEALQQKIIMRGRLWRAQPEPGSAQVLEMRPDDAAAMLEKLCHAVDPGKGATILAAMIGNSAMLFAHPVILGGLSLQKIAAEIDAELSSDPQSVQDSVDIPTTDQVDWNDVLEKGPTSAWWISPGDKLPIGSFTRASGTTHCSNAVQIINAALQVARALSQTGTLVADVEVIPPAIGPLSSVPVMVQPGQNSMIGNAASYAQYLSTRRPIAGGAGLLVRHTLARRGEPFDCIPNGTNRLYRIVAAWERMDENTRLEVTSHEAIAADAFVEAWVKALSNRDEAHG
ncbi:non-ribosomal peptide synthetase [Brucellaceae bacterium D45D]